LVTHSLGPIVRSSPPTVRQYFEVLGARLSDCTTVRLDIWNLAVSQAQGNGEYTIIASKGQSRHVLIGVLDSRAIQPNSDETVQKLRIARILLRVIKTLEQYFVPSLSPIGMPLPGPAFKPRTVWPAVGRCVAFPPSHW